MKIYCPNEFCSQVAEVQSEKNEFGLYGVCDKCGLSINDITDVKMYQKGILEIVAERNEYNTLNPKRRGTPKGKGNMNLVLIRQKDRTPNQIVFREKQPKQPVQEKAKPVIVDKPETPKKRAFARRPNTHPFQKTTVPEKQAEKKEKESIFSKIFKMF